MVLYDEAMLLPAKPAGSVPIAKGRRRFPSNTATLLIIIVVCGLPSSVYPVPLPSSSAWSLPSLNYFFKDTKTKSHSNNFVVGQGSHETHHHLSSSPHHKEKSLLHDGDTHHNAIEESNPTLSTDDGKAASTGRLISSHDIRMTDNWGWVRRGASDPAQTTETRRKQNRNNIRHSKSKHKQRHSSSSSSSPSIPSTSSFYSSSSMSSSSRGKKKENLLCPFDEIRGPDGKCRKAPRFSLYRVGRK
ncbi:unnamed protein product [Orchesella dallaii]|uniref:Uncharacterized protein n=1 Tax=Orchesella dallaii TaxID=48710 RepID=A0ABP1Q7Z5_9HEXA